MSSLRAILKQNHISITKTRIAMLDIFMHSREPLTQNNFLDNNVIQLDRTSIFRTLKLFAQKNIIYRIPATDGISRYLLRQASTIVHSSFICHSCKKVIPLKTLIIPKVELPENFIQENMEIVIEGTCNSCKSTANILLKNSKPKT